MGAPERPPGGAADDETGDRHEQQGAHRATGGMFRRDGIANMAPNLASCIELVGSGTVGVTGRGGPHATHADTAGDVIRRTAARGQ